MSNRTKKISKTIIGLLLAVGVFVLFGFFGTFTNGFTSEFKTFYVQHGDRIITSDIDGFEVRYNEPTTFKVGYSLGELGGVNDFNVEVYANATSETDFEYKVGGRTFRYVALKDPLTKCFDVVKTEEGFTFTVRAELLEILEEYYLDQEVENVPIIGNVEKDYLKVVVSTPDNSMQIAIGLRVVGILSLAVPGGILL